MTSSSMCLRVTSCNLQVPSFTPLRHSRCPRKGVPHRFHTSASGRHSLTVCSGPIKGVLTAPLDECLLRFRTSLGVHSTVGDLPAISKPVITLPRDYSVGTRPWGTAMRVHNTVHNVIMVLISEVMILLLRDVNDWR